MDDNADLLTVWAVADDDCLRVVLAGELDLDEVTTLFREVRRVLQTWRSPREVKLDLRHLRFVDLDGLRALTTVCREMERAERRCSVVSVPYHVMRAIEVTGIEIPALVDTAQQTSRHPAAVAQVGRAMRSRTAVPLEPDRSSTRSHS